MKGYSITRRVEFDVEFNAGGEVYIITEWDPDEWQVTVRRVDDDVVEPGHVFHIAPGSSAAVWSPIGLTWASQREVAAVCAHLNEHGLPPDLGELTEDDRDLHRWEQVEFGGTLGRYRVPGGWLYGQSNRDVLVFVPEVTPR